MKGVLNKLCWIVFLVIISTENAGAYSPERVHACLSLKQPGNVAVNHKLTFKKENGTTGMSGEWRSDKMLPATIHQKITEEGVHTTIEVIITATEDIYFNYGQWYDTGLRHSDCLFYMPGFWYRRNLRSPKEAPSFHSADSWLVREDRLSVPLTGIMDENNGTFFTVNRIDDFTSHALVTHKDGEVILSGKTSIGYTGFENVNGQACLAFGYPYKETPRSYIRKLNLALPVVSFQYLKAGKKIKMIWRLREGQESEFSDLVRNTWEYCYHSYAPEPVVTSYKAEDMKKIMSNFFIESFVDDKPLNYFSGVHIRTDDCKSSGVAEVGFIGRVLLNAFNAWEYGHLTSRNELIQNARLIFDSYLRHGFTLEGFFKEYVNYDMGADDDVLSIRRQSEGIYAMLHYLRYEKKNARRHPEWENRMKRMLDMFLDLQHPDGSFPRKFKGDKTMIDRSGGSTPSAILPLVMGYKYFNDKRYLDAAKKSAVYLEREIISRSDYFSSTLDANCEDKEASLYAATATYYLALVSKGKERIYYAELSKKASYFALSWYYLWDVPFAQGQMLGDIGFKTRGWGNVSVENNHVDVFVFEFASVLRWLSEMFDKPMFSEFADVIHTSMRQLLPHEGNLCGIAREGYYPEVVQHTNWDYGKNGKGYYNDIFAPGWTIASLWELFSPGRIEHFLLE